jgi:hypothetical protein
MAAKKKRIARKKVTVKKKVRPLAKKRPVKRLAKRKPAARKPAPKKSAPKLKENVIGLVTHYFPQVRAAVIKLKAPLAIGDAIKIKGHTTDFKQAITSMQIDRTPITSAKKGDEIGLLVDSRVRQHDVVYKV